MLCMPAGELPPAPFDKLPLWGEPQEQGR
jgi:hypothetical protein